MKCPECGYVRKNNEDVPEWQCPSCGIAYNKHPNYKGGAPDTPDSLESKLGHHSTKKKKYMLKILLAILIMSLLLGYLSKKEIVNSRRKIPPVSSQLKVSKPKRDVLAMNQISLPRLLVRLSEIQKLSNSCKSVCDVTKRSSVSCDEFLSEAKSALNEVERLRHIYNLYGKRRFTSAQKIHTMRVKDKANIVNRERFYFSKNCKKNDISSSKLLIIKTVKKKTKTLFARDFGINLNKIIETQEVKLSLMEKCAESCVRSGRLDANCVALKQFRDRNDGELQSYVNIVNRNGWSAFSQEDQSKFKTIRKLIIQFNQHVRISNKCAR